MSNVLVIADTHIPFSHKKYLNFCKKVKVEFNCTTVIHIGDVVDNHAISYWETDPDGLASGAEYKASIAVLKKWYDAFPNVLVTVGNHDKLPFRKALTHGLSREFMKPYKDLWQCPKGWVWDTSYVIDGVKYVHGTGSAGKFGHINRAHTERQSIVMGHTHSNGGVGYLTNNNNIIFGLNVGAGISISEYNTVYARDFARRPTLGAGVVLDNGRIAQFVPMKI